MNTSHHLAHQPAPHELTHHTSSTVSGRDVPDHNHAGSVQTLTTLLATARAAQKAPHNDGLDTDVDTDASGRNLEGTRGKDAR